MEKLKRYFASYYYKDLYPFNKIKVIGITGSIGSGKSTVSRHLTNMGYYVIWAYINYLF